MTLAGVIVAIFALVSLLLSGPGTRWGWWDFKVGLGLFAIAFLAALLALVISGVSWVKTRNPPAAVAAIAAALILILPLAQLAGAAGKPRIHDISTDLTDPPQFSAVLPLRAGANPAPDRIDDTTARLQRAAYPDLSSFTLPMNTAETFAKASAAAMTMHWTIVSSRPADGILEASDATAWFGFRDDIVVRVRPSGEQSIIDVRSCSRVGRGDAGKNAERIRRFLQILAGHS